MGTANACVLQDDVDRCGTGEREGPMLPLQPFFSHVADIRIYNIHNCPQFCISKQWDSAAPPCPALSESGVLVAQSSYPGDKSWLPYFAI